MKFSSTLASFFLATLIGGTGVAMAETYPMVDVNVDRAKVMRISRPASMVIIGNPAIADATIKDSQTLIITGRQYGITNLIVLDADGEPIADEVLNVKTSTDNHVVIYKGAKRQTLACTPNCEPVFRIGDDKETVNDLTAQIKTYGEMSKGMDIELQNPE